MKRKNNKNDILPGQLSFQFDVPRESDRNFHLGGRSFYFFDFDDNVAFLSTPIIIFHKKTNVEIALSSGEFAHENKNIGISGMYSDYYMDFNDAHGSFRHFRDKDLNPLEIKEGKKQGFVEDVLKALKELDTHWKAPSWEYFYHATYNHRPVSLITARGHHPTTIIEGVDQMVRAGYLPHAPNYHSIYPVSNPEVRKDLGDIHFKQSVAELKKHAIRASVEKAIELYGYSPFHRFGMSDDDHKNVELITEEMRDLKHKYPEMSFFVIETFKDSFSKREVLLHETREIISAKESMKPQLSLFD
ncbi:MAG: hypothetical protein H7336_01630 [Bacteriovorax sp.]|nr:hypothetical protein [Bacteriovorax sp.]